MSQAARAEVAYRRVEALFGHRLCGLPGTHLAAVAVPRPRGLLRSWNYWWQAHYLDALVDAALRARRGGDAQGGSAAAATASALCRGIVLRNGGRITNGYADDMAWLALALHRLARFYGEGPEAARADRAVEVLRARISRLERPEGGMYWRTRRDFVNAAATSPTALLLAQRGDPERARSLLEWTYLALHDPSSGLVMDGVRSHRGRDGRVHPEHYSYNQGTTLGALLALGEPVDLARAEDLIEAIARRLTLPDTGTGTGEGGGAGADAGADADAGGSGGEPRFVLRGHGGGDGALFTGIAARYLAGAALDPRLSPSARGTARRLVVDTAEALWAGRAERPVSDRDRHTGVRELATVFSPEPGEPATAQLGAPVELSAQLQAWITLEAAATIEAAPHPGG